MDYKYIEQLVQRYWDCLTSPEEEKILRTFFSQEKVPAELARYKSLFEYEQKQGEEGLSDDFDQRMLACVGMADNAPQESRRTCVRRVTWANRLRPLYRAAAAVAIVTLLGTAVQHSFSPRADETAGWDYNQATYKDTYRDPQKAYEAGMKALEMFKKGPKTAVADSASRHGGTQLSDAPQPHEED